MRAAQAVGFTGGSRRPGTARRRSAAPRAPRLELAQRRANVGLDGTPRSASTALRAAGIGNARPSCGPWPPPPRPRRNARAPPARPARGAPWPGPRSRRRRRRQPAHDQRLGPDEDRRPSSRYGENRSQGASETLSPARFGASLAQRHDLDRHRVAAAGSERVDVERQRRAGRSGRREVALQRRPVEREVGRGDHRTPSAPASAAWAESATVSAVVWAPQWANTASRPSRPRGSAAACLALGHRQGDALAGAAAGRGRRRSRRPPGSRRATRRPPRRSEPPSRSGVTAAANAPRSSPISADASDVEVAGQRAERSQPLR